MSLLKARRIKEGVELDSNKVFGEFQGLVNDYIKDSKKDTAVDIIDAYCQYSYTYLLMTSQLLQPIQEMKDKMIYMNSLIAEICNEQTIPYFHPNGGYSIIDVGVKAYIDNGLQPDTKYLYDIIAEMEVIKKQLEEDDRLEEELTVVAETQKD